MIVFVVIFEASRDWGNDCLCFASEEQAVTFAKTVKGKVQRRFVEKGKNELSNK